MNRILTALFLTLVLLASISCERIPRKLTDRDIQLMSVTKISGAWIDLPDGSQLLLDSSQFGEMNSLLSSLSPITAAKTAELPDSEYQLNYRSGMDPTCIRVKIDGDQLIFSLGEFVYIGGKSQTFSDTLCRLVNEAAEEAK